MLSVDVKRFSIFIYKQKYINGTISKKIFYLFRIFQEGPLNGYPVKDAAVKQVVIYSVCSIKTLTSVYAEMNNTNKNEIIVYVVVSLTESSIHNLMNKFLFTVQLIIYQYRCINDREFRSEW